MEETIGVEGGETVPASEFSGNYAHSIDPKGRVTIPSAYREALGESFTIGLNNEFSAIALYPAQKWEEIGQKLERIPETDAFGTEYVRIIQAFSFTGQKLDAQGRVLLPMGLRQQAGMDKNIRFVGMGRYLEIWDEEKFKAVYMRTRNNIAELLAHVNERYFSPGRV